jgi:hypothetical protein
LNKNLFGDEDHYIKKYFKTKSMTVTSSTNALHGLIDFGLSQHRSPMGASSLVIKAEPHLPHPGH